MPGIDGIETYRRLGAGGRRSRLRCVIVTAHDDEQMWAAARRQGIGTVLVKPVSASTLHDALTEVLATGTTRRSLPLPPPTGDGLHALQSTRRGARILLAEDNVINQEVAVELLRSAGLAVDVASNGAEAIAMGQAHAYDLILMDVQMPEVDGLQATRALRATPNGRAVAIIAMTANAFDEDRDVCLAAGMNDHVAKPVDPDALYATLLRWLPQRDADSSARPVEEPRAAAEPTLPSQPPVAWRARLEAIGGFDVGRGLQLFDGRTEIYLRVLRQFATTYADGMPQIDQALAADSINDLAAAGHSLRGASGSIGATRLEEHAGALEQYGKRASVTADVAAAAVALQAVLIETTSKMREVVAAEHETRPAGAA
jgi:CheY-like chemotaxis protein/HPt (histidine-containing phosphotransfer) domain-containing protein